MNSARPWSRQTVPFTRRVVGRQWAARSSMPSSVRTALSGAARRNRISGGGAQGQHRRVSGLAGRTPKNSTRRLAPGSCEVRGRRRYHVTHRPIRRCDRSGPRADPKPACCFLRRICDASVRSCSPLPLHRRFRPPVLGPRPVREQPTRPRPIRPTTSSAPARTPTGSRWRSPASRSPISRSRSRRMR